MVVKLLPTTPTMAKFTQPKFPKGKIPCAASENVPRELLLMRLQQQQQLLLQLCLLVGQPGQPDLAWTTDKKQTKKTAVAKGSQEPRGIKNFSLLLEFTRKQHFKQPTRSPIPDVAKNNNN